VLEPGRYLLPIIGTSVLGELSDSTVFVDVTVRTPYEDPDGYELYTGEDMFTVFYINTSAFEPRLANDMILTERIPSSGVEYKGLGNIVNLRTASVGYDSTTGKVSIQPSADLRYVLEHSSERVLPVQESGCKVCVCMQWEESSPENIWIMHGQVIVTEQNRSRQSIMISGLNNDNTDIFRIAWKPYSN